MRIMTNKIKPPRGRRVLRLRHKLRTGIKNLQHIECPILL